MTILHVREQGAVVRKDGEQVQVTQKDKTQQKQVVLAGAPIRELTQVAVYGNVQVTTQAAALLLEHEIDLVFLSMYGKFRGRLTNSGSKFARLRHAQLRFAGDENRTLAVAGAIVHAKLTNQRNLLQTIAGEISDPAVVQRLQQARRRIEAARNGAAQALHSDSLRGYEGQAGAAYFDGMQALVTADWNFVGRQYYPAPDPLNALLSFGYALLMKDCSAAIQLVGLDPYLGCFHALEYDRPSLTLDLMEEFRPLIVDRTVLQLVRSGMITPGNFTFTNHKARPVELGEALIPNVIEAYERRLEQFVPPRQNRPRSTWRRALAQQARRYARVVMGEQNDYVGMIE